MDGLITHIDLNADLGEGLANEAQIMALISSCNVACGGHFGDRSTVMQTLKLAKKQGVKVGAHPGYPDKANFGRRELNISTGQLKQTLVQQLDLFKSCCQDLELEIHHIKPHGALYNKAASDPETAAVILEACNLSNCELPIYCLAGSQMEAVFGKNYQIIPEAFIDRTYNSDGTLVSRTRAGALIKTPQVAWEQLKSLIFKNQLKTIEGEIIKIDAETYCIHSDTPEALSILKYIHERLAELNISLSS